MKRIKVFEQFRDTGQLGTLQLDKYEILKELPVPGRCFCSIDEIEVIQQYLENYQYKAWREETDIPENTPGIRWWIFMDRNPQYEFLDNNNSRTHLSNEVTIDFNDYFELKHEYRGHKLKKFGV